MNAKELKLVKGTGLIGTTLDIASTHCLYQLLSLTACFTCCQQHNHTGLSAFLWNFVWHVPSSAGKGKRRGKQEHHRSMPADAVRVLTLCTRTLVQILSSIVRMAPPTAASLRSSSSSSAQKSSSSSHLSVPLVSPPSSPPTNAASPLSLLDVVSNDRLVVVVRCLSSLFECVRIGHSWKLQLFPPQKGKPETVQEGKSTPSKNNKTSRTATANSSTSLLASLTRGLVHALQPETFAPVMSSTTNSNKLSHDQIRLLMNDTRRCSLSLLTLLLLTKQLEPQVLAAVVQQQCKSKTSSSIFGLVSVAVWFVRGGGYWMFIVCGCLDVCWLVCWLVYLTLIFSFDFLLCTVVE